MKLCILHTSQIKALLKAWKLPMGGNKPQLWKRIHDQFSVPEDCDDQMMHPVDEHMCLQYLRQCWGVCTFVTYPEGTIGCLDVSKTGVDSLWHICTQQGVPGCEQNWSRLTVAHMCTARGAWIKGCLDVSKTGVDSLWHICAQQGVPGCEQNWSRLTQQQEPPHNQRCHRLGVAVQQLALAQAHSGTGAGGAGGGPSSDGEDWLIGNEDDVD
eukprot:1161678-Pelagomonas_calceolata.AAC.5